MNTNAIAIDDRFTEMELFDLFNVEIAPDIDAKHGEKRRPIEERYYFDDVKVRLWKTTKRRLPRGERKSLQTKDNLRRGISDHAPGSRGRLDDLQKYYSGLSAEAEISPFHETE